MSFQINKIKNPKTQKTTNFELRFTPENEKRHKLFESNDICVFNFENPLRELSETSRLVGGQFPLQNYKKNYRRNQQTPLRENNLKFNL
jgi:hypothetical protein